MPQSLHNEIIPQLREGLENVLENKQILAIGATSTLFEGSLYLFVFCWSPAMQAARILSQPLQVTDGRTLDYDNQIPFGLIFACFMTAMMMGSLLFDLFVSSSKPRGPAKRLLISTLAIASAALLVPVVCKSERYTFWNFCIFEVCTGIYWPSMGVLKGEIIDDAKRARIYALLRIPLNIFVVVGLVFSFTGAEEGITGDGGYRRDWTFTVCSGCLLVASRLLQRPSIAE